MCLIDYKRQKLRLLANSFGAMQELTLRLQSLSQKLATNERHLGLSTHLEHSLLAEMLFRCTAEFPAHGYSMTSWDASRENAESEKYTIAAWSVSHRLHLLSWSMKCITAVLEDPSALLLHEKIVLQKEQREKPETFASGTNSSWYGTNTGYLLHKWSEASGFTATTEKMSNAHSKCAITQNNGNLKG